MADLEIQRNPWNFAGWLSYINPANYNIYTGYYYLTYNSAKFKNKEKVSITIGNETFWNVGSFTDSSTNPSVRVWRITPTDFAPYVEKLARLGNGASYDLQEQIRFHIEDKNNSSIHAEAIGEVRAKPVSVDLISVSASKTGLESKEQSRDVTWNYIGYDNQGVYNSVKVELIPSSGTTITKYILTTSKKFTSVMSELQYKTDYTLKLSLGFRAQSGAFYRYSNGYTKTIPNFVRRDPTPTSAPKISGSKWGTVKDEQTRTLSWNYTGDTGIANYYEVVFTNTSTGTPDIQMYTTGNSLSLGMSNFVIGVSYDLRITAYYKGTDPNGNPVRYGGSSVTVSDFVTRNPVPTALVTCAPNTLGVIRDEQSRDIYFTYTSSNTNGIMNKIRVELLKSDDTVVYDKSFSAGYVLNTPKTFGPFNLKMDVCDFQSPMKLRVTPYFNDLAGTPNTLNNFVTRDPKPISQFTLTNPLGVVKDLGSRNIEISYICNNTNGIMNWFDMLFTDETDGVIVSSYEMDVVPNLNGITSAMRIIYPKNCIISHSISLRVRIGFKKPDGTILYGNSVYYQNPYFTFNPTPTGKVTVSPSKIGKISDESVKWVNLSYNNDPKTFGIANGYIVNFYKADGTLDRTIELPTDVTTFSIDPKSFIVSEKYTLGVTPKYDSNIGTSSVEIAEYFYRDPTPRVMPTITINDLQATSNVTVDKQNLKITLSIPQTEFVNKYGIKLIGPNSTVYFDEIIDAGLITSGDKYITTYSIDLLDIGVPINTPFNVIATPINRVDETDLIGPFGRFLGIILNFGIDTITKMSPLSSDVAWFSSPNVSDNPTFRIVFRLPVDKNYQYLTPEEQEAYRYKRIEVVVNNQSFNYPNPVIGVTDGVPSHNSVIIFKLDEFSKYIAPISDGTKNLYSITINVVGQFNNVATPVTFTVRVEPFPASMSESSNEGEFIRADKVNELLHATAIIKSFVDDNSNYVYTKNYSTVNRRDEIRYMTFAPIIDTVVALYNITKDLDNPNKYSCPMMLSSQGLIPAPYYRSLPIAGDNCDYVYELSNEKVPTLTKLSVKPEDYDTNFNDYFQKSENFVFRSRNNSFTPSMVYSSDTGDYNVLYSYYLLLKTMATSIIEEDVDGFISGTITELEKINIASATEYALAYLTNVTSLTLPAISRYICDGDTSLTTVVLDESITSIPNYVFRGCPLSSITLLNREDVVTATNTSFGGTTYIKNATILVPSSLVDAYKADSWWSTYEDHIQAYDI